MDPSLFEELETTLAGAGASAAIDRLCAALEARKEYAALFYALLLKKRHELGVSPVPTAPAQELPEAVHEPFEDGIRQACRRVGRLFLDAGDIPQAWVYFRMLGEPEPVAEALERCEPADGQDIQALVEVAFHEAVHPQRGFDWILARYGICNAITTVTSQELGLAANVREYCVRRLVRGLYTELQARLAAEVERREGREAGGVGIRRLIERRDWLFADESYHIDASHLSAVVQLSVYLKLGEELQMARELCEYAGRLAPCHQYAGEPPFEDRYRDLGLYLAALAGERQEEAIAHFEAKVERASGETEDTRPAEALVNLLVAIGRTPDAANAARRHLAGRDTRRLNCPGALELYRRAGDYSALAALAREQGDPVHFLAGLLGKS
jgi:hypothetical protein